MKRVLQNSFIEHLNNMRSLRSFITLCQSVGRKVNRPDEFVQRHGLQQLVGSVVVDVIEGQVDVDQLGPGAHDETGQCLGALVHDLKKWTR